MNEDKLPIFQLGAPKVSTIKPVTTSGIKTTTTGISTSGFNPKVSRSTSVSTPKLSYFERKGETRFDTIMNATGQIVNTAAGITAVINELKGGRTVYIQDSSTGQQRRMTADDMALLESQAQYAQQNGGQIDTATLFAMLNQQNANKNNNTMLYVGLGVGALVLVGVIMMSQKKTK